MQNQKTRFVMALSLVLSSITGFAQMEVDVHGFISQGIMGSTDYNFQSLETVDGTAEFNEMGINFSTDISDNLRAGVQLFSRDYGSVGNNSLVVDWAYGDYSFNDSIGIRVGRIKSAMGLYNETRDIDLVRTSILLPQSIYNETFRDLQSAINGFELYGMLPMNNYGDLLYKVQVGYSNVDPENSGVTARFAADGAVDIEDIESHNTYAGSLSWLTPLSGLRIVGTASQFGFKGIGTSSDPTSPGDYVESSYDLKEVQSGSLSAEYMTGDWVFNAEYAYSQVDIDVELYDTSLLGDISGNSGMEQAGGYLGSSYRVNDLVELGTYYSLLDNIHDDRMTKDLALSLRLDLTPSWILKLEGHWLNGAEDVYPANDNPARADSDGEDWFLFAAKTTMSF